MDKVFIVKKIKSKTFIFLQRQHLDKIKNWIMKLSMRGTNKINNRTVCMRMGKI